MSQPPRRAFLGLLAALSAAPACTVIRSWADRLRDDPLGAFLEASDAVQRAVALARVAFAQAERAVPGLAEREADFTLITERVLHGLDVARELLGTAQDVQHGQVLSALSGAYAALEDLYRFLGEVGVSLPPAPLSAGRAGAAPGPRRTHANARTAVLHALPPARRAALLAADAR